jgi:hypothetical protein
MKTETRDELARADRYKYFLNSLAGSLEQFHDRDRYDKVVTTLKILFDHRL